ncbi:MAG: beta-ketoacyl synthase N-terminal-like domain-containing protein, partial [Pirellulales bacterium]
MRRVVVTGLGVVSPLGNTKEALWEALLAGQSGVRLSELPPGTLPARFAAEARQFTGAIEDFGPLQGDQKKSIRKGLKVMCRESQMGVAAAQLALHDAGLAAGKFDPERAGVVYGSDYMVTIPTEFSAPILECLQPAGQFDFSRWAQHGIGKMNPLWLLKYLPNMPASHIAIYNDLRGPNNSLTLREAAANLAVGEAYNVIVRGHAEVMIAGATGTRIHPMKALHASQQEELANGEVEPTKASRPFDLDRSGMVLSEGAGAVVLEELEFARGRGATIYAEVAAAASSSAADSRLVARRDTALANALRGAISKAGLCAEDIGHIHAHGLST